MLKRLIAGLASAALILGAVPTFAQGQPVQWRYSFDENGVATATYPGNVDIAGEVIAGPINQEFALSGGPNAGVDYRGSTYYIPSDTVDVDNGFVVGKAFIQEFGGPQSKGGRVLGDFQLYQTSPTAIANVNRNYVALQGIINNLASDGGSMGAERGAYFGFSSAFRCAGTFLLECTGGEINSYAQAGSSIKYKALWTLVGGGPEDAVQGTTWDAMLALSNQTGSVKWKDGILIGNMNGEFPIAATGTIIRTEGVGTARTGIDFSTMTFNDLILNGRTMSIAGNGRITAPEMVFSNSSGGVSQKNFRVISAGGSLNIQAANDDLSTFTDAYAIAEDAQGVASHSWSVSSAPGTPITYLQMTRNSIISGLPIRLANYTVGALPPCNAGSRGQMAYVTDAAAPTYNATLVGGGAVVVPAFCNGVTWTSH